MNILLIGLRGSGKTTLGPGLAGALQFAFIDLDDLVARAMGEPSAGDAFRKHGQAAFRQQEGRLLPGVLVPERQVVALGGGTPTGMAALDTIRREQGAGRARVIYLRGTPATLRDRLARTDLAQRPGITGVDPLAEIEALFERRDPLYSTLADAVVEIDGLDAAGAASALEQAARDALAGR